jgi:hypothetical protein
MKPFKVSIKLSKLLLMVVLTFYRYFQCILTTIASPTFYNKYVKLPSADDPVPPEILNNPKFFPFFEGAPGGMDGSHFDFSPFASGLKNFKHHGEAGPASAEDVENECK